MIAYLRTFFSTEAPLRPIGFTNRGTDCCFISALQLLYHTPSWQSLVNRSIRWAYNCGKEGSLNLSQIRQSFRIPDQPNHALEQTDPMEYIRAIADRANKTMQVYTIRNGSRRKEKEAPILGLAMPNLSFFSSYTLPSLLAHYFDDQNRDLRTQKQLVQAPQDLIACVQRFQTVTSHSWMTSLINVILRLLGSTPIASSLTLQKISSNVQMDLALTLKPQWVHNASCPVSYEAKSFICHSGTLHFGHYISFVKTHNGQWWKCNDNVITAISPKQAATAIKQSYVVSYQKVDK